MEKEWFWQNRFTNFGVRITSTRKMIISILNSSQAHLSVEEIFKEAFKINPSTGLTTLYRNLNLLEKMGIVQKFIFGDGKARYELIDKNKRKGHHHHLVCLKCKSIIDYSDFSEEEVKLINETEEKLIRKYNFKITNHIINFYGLCGKCQKF